MRTTLLLLLALCLCAGCERVRAVCYSNSGAVIYEGTGKLIMLSRGEMILREFKSGRAIRVSGECVTTELFDEGE